MRRHSVLGLALILGLALSANGLGQTRLDLSRQGRNIDFSSASSTKPFKTGVSIPVVCGLGEVYLKTDEIPGRNIYVCTASNTWTQLTASEPAAESAPWAVTRATGTQLTISPGADLRFGSSVCPAATSAATLTLSGGTGRAYIHVTSACVLTVTHNVAMAGCSGCGLSGGTSFPTDSFPIAEWEITSGQFAATGTNHVAAYGVDPVLAGANVQVVTSGGLATVSVARVPSTREIHFRAATCNGGTGRAEVDTAASGAPTTVCVAGSNTNYGVLEFTEADGDFALQGRFKLPDTWAGAMEWSGFWRANATTGDVAWQLQTACVANNESGDPAWNAAQVVPDSALGTANRWNAFNLNNVTTTGCSAGETFHFKVLRNRTHSSDTLLVPPQLINWTFKIQTTD